MDFNGVINANGDLMRAGHADFSNSLKTGESQINDIPRPALIKPNKSITRYHRWNGAIWEIVNKSIATPVTLELYPTDTITIREEDVPTGGHYQALGIEIDVNASGTITKDVSFPHPISLMAAEWTNKPSLIGDEVEFIVAPNTIVGALTQDAPAGSGTLYVSSTVIDNIQIGYQLKLFNAPSTQKSCGRVLGVDTENNTVLVENAPTQTFTVEAPTYVQQEVHLYSRSFLAGEGRVQLGEAKIGGSYIPANTTIRANYYNNNGTNKKLVFIIEYLY